MVKKKKEKYPSQEKYEKENPCITVRMKKHEKEKIQQFAIKSRTSISELIRITLLGFEDASTADMDIAFSQGIEQGKEEGYQDAFNEGYKKGKQDWAISLKCWICKQLVEIEPNSYAFNRVRFQAETVRLHESCSQK